MSIFHSDYIVGTVESVSEPAEAALLRPSPLD